MKIMYLLQDRRKETGVVVFALFLLLLIAGWLVWPNAFFRGYWLALMFWAQLSIGALIVLLLQYLTAGEWGKVGAPILSASAFGLFLLIPLFVPGLLALPHIFSWTKIEPGVSAVVLVNKQVWLNPAAFILRTGFYLGAFAFIISLRRKPIIRAASGPFFVAAIVLISFCSADWMMSLQPTFYSSLYPFLYFSDAMVVAFSMLAGTVAWRQLNGSMSKNPELLLDYGKLLFSAVFFWGYIVFSQFIIIWTGNLPDEAEWYIVRSEPSWLWLTVLIIVAHFVIPFCVLLSHDLKKNPRPLLAISVWLFVVHFLEVFWLMRPTPGEGFSVTPFDFLMPVIMGAGWIWFVSGAREIVPPDPQPEALHET